MVGQRIGLGKEVFERRLVAELEAVRGTEARIEVILKIRAEVDLGEGILLFFRSLRSSSYLFSWTIPLCLAALHVVEQRNAFLDFIEDWVLCHLRLDHLLQLELVQRQYADHLHKARGQNLALSHFEAQLRLKKRHCHSLWYCVIRP